MILAKLSRLGRFLEDDAFQSVVSDAFAELLVEQLGLKRRILPDATCICEVFSSSDRADGLTRLVVDAYGRYGGKEEIQELLQWDNIPAGFAKQLSLLLLDLRSCRTNDFARLQTCDYHSHGPEQDCNVSTSSHKRQRLQ